MNLPNKLTLLRMLLIPLFLAAFFLQYYQVWQGGYLCAFVLFVAASYTDHLDGAIARKRGLVTDFGKLMDPLADKILVMAAMLCLMAGGLVHPLVVIAILAREFLVTSVRTVGAGKGVVIAADNWGKAKTVAQMIWICDALLLMWLSFPVSIGYLAQRSELLMKAGTVLLWAHYIFTAAVVLLTLISGINYTIKNRNLFNDA